MKELIYPEGMIYRNLVVATHDTGSRTNYKRSNLFIQINNKYLFI